MASEGPISGNASYLFNYRLSTFSLIAPLLPKGAGSIRYQNLSFKFNIPDPKARVAMVQAAYLSGKAINISKTTAPHAVSYAITTGFQVPHGMAVALIWGLF